MRKLRTTLVTENNSDHTRMWSLSIPKWSVTQSTVPYVLKLYNNHYFCNNKRQNNVNWNAVPQASGTVNLELHVHEMSSWDASKHYEIEIQELIIHWLLSGALPTGKLNIACRSLTSETDGRLFNSMQNCKKFYAKLIAMYTDIEFN